ncbi:MAG: NADH-quinone oxidoreductase subunit J [Schwartzia succinivorans]|nr:NADH-quinone oxidoreductase subunit J [Schwartzia succinivorans]
MNELLKLVHGVVNWGMDTAESMNAGVLIDASVFYALMWLSVLAALGVVLCRNVVHSALLLTASFIGVGCLYIYMDSPFIGAVQFLVYGGAVAILIVMALMLTRRDDMAHSNLSRSLFCQAGAAVISGAFFLCISVASLMTQFREMPAELGDSVTGLADMMLTKYILPFEVAAVLLLIAMIGALVIAKGAHES